MIKKQFLAAALLLSIHSFAQFNKGQIMINGRINFYSSKQHLNNNNPYSDIVRYKDFGYNVNVGYFLTNHFAIGLVGGLSLDKQVLHRFDTAYTYIHTQVHKAPTVGAFMRYNQPLYKSKFGVFLQLNSNYSFLKTSYDSQYNYPDPTQNSSSYARKEKGNRYSLALNPGLFYFVNNRISLEGTLGSLYYSASKVKIEDELDPNSQPTSNSSFLGTNFSISSISLGVTFYLGKNKNSANESSAAETK
jgi:hypothetical protein